MIASRETVNRGKRGTVKAINAAAAAKPLIFSTLKTANRIPFELSKFDFSHEAVPRAHGRKTLFSCLREPFVRFSPRVEFAFNEKIPRASLREACAIYPDNNDKQKILYRFTSANDGIGIACRYSEAVKRPAKNSVNYAGFQRSGKYTTDVWYHGFSKKILKTAITVR